MSDRPSDGPEPGPSRPSDGQSAPLVVGDPQAIPHERSRGPLVAGTVVLALVGLLAWAGAGALSDGDRADPRQQLGQKIVESPNPSAAPGKPCAYTLVGGEARDVKGAPPPIVRSTNRASVTLRTSQGVIGLSLNRLSAPCTVNSFTFLAKQGYYNDSTCHRLTTSGIFVLQCGDPTGTGSGGPGYTYVDENLAGAVYPKGTVAMANSGPATNGSQFFLVYKDTRLPPNYTPFGTITQGLDVLEKVAAGGSTPSGDGTPNLSVRIRAALVAS